MQAKKKRLISEVYHKNTPIVIPRVGGNWADPACYIGVEIEAENIKYVNGAVTGEQELLSGGWRITQDGSLRNGLEFVFSQPLLGLDADTALDVFFREVTFTPSPRAGIHVHVDWRSEDADALPVLMGLLYCYEAGIFASAGEGRKQSSYCRPLIDAPDSEVLQLFRGGTFEAIVQRIRNLRNNRYFGANLLSLDRHGTVEFRYFPSVHDRAKVARWINMCMLFKRAAADCGMDTRTLLAYLSSPQNVAEFAGRYFSFDGIGDELLAGMDIDAAASRMYVMNQLMNAVELSSTSMRRSGPTTRSPALTRALQGVFGEEAAAAGTSSVNFDEWARLTSTQQSDVIRQWIADGRITTLTSSTAGTTTNTFTYTRGNQ